MVDQPLSLGEVRQLDRNPAAIMRSFGMHCLGCPHAVMESLEMACAAHGADVDELVRQLNDYFAKKEAK